MATVAGETSVASIADGDSGEFERKSHDVSTPISHGLRVYFTAPMAATDPRGGSVRPVHPWPVDFVEDAVIDHLFIGELHRLLHAFFQQLKGDLELPLSEIRIAQRDAILRIVRSSSWCVISIESRDYFNLLPSTVTGSRTPDSRRSPHDIWQYTRRLRQSLQ